MIDIDELKAYIGNDLWYTEHHDFRPAKYRRKAIFTLSIYKITEEDPIFIKNFQHSKDMHDFIESLNIDFID